MTDTNRLRVEPGMDGSWSAEDEAAMRVEMGSPADVARADRLRLMLAEELDALRAGRRDGDGESAKGEAA